MVYILYCVHVVAFLSFLQSQSWEPLHVWCCSSSGNIFLTLYRSCKSNDGLNLKRSKVRVSYRRHMWFLTHAADHGLCYQPHSFEICFLLSVLVFSWYSFAWITTFPSPPSLQIRPCSTSSTSSARSISTEVIGSCRVRVPKNCQQYLIINIICFKNNLFCLILRSLLSETAFIPSWTKAPN